MTEIEHTNGGADLRRAAGLALRNAAIEHFTGSDFRAALTRVLSEDDVAQQRGLPPGLDFAGIRLDMERDPSWMEEFWSIDRSGEVALVDAKDFHGLPPEERFSNSDCLRTPLRDSYSLRGMLSALGSPDVLASIASIARVPNITFLTSDIARYRPGHFLRRHDDLFDGRLFAMVLFLHSTWEPGNGTELVAEKPDGRATVVRPLPGTYGLMRLAGGNFHFVTSNTTSDWTRYSIAVHFGVKA